MKLNAALLLTLLLSLQKVSAQDVGGSRQVKLASTLKRLEQVLTRLRSKQLIVTETFPPVKRNVALNIPPFKLDIKSDKKVICYFYANTITSRPQNLLAQNIDQTLCTHIIVQEFYQIVMPENNTFQLEMMKSSRPEFESQVRDLLASKGGSKIILSLGGSEREEARKFSALVSSKTSRTNFINLVTGVLTRDKFAGLYIFWPRPSCWFSDDCTRSRADDRKNYASFVQELGDVFKPLGLLLTCVLSTDSLVHDKGFDMAVFNKYMDWMVLPTFGKYGPWNKYVERFSGTLSDFKADMLMALTRAYKRNKLILGLSASTVTYTLLDKKRTALLSPATGLGKPGIFSNSGGNFYFYEVCYVANTESWSVEPRVNPIYMFKDDQWIPYDDISAIRQKMQHVMTEGLAGAALLHVNHDDFMDLCGCGRFPLLRAINEELRGARAVLPNCT